MKKGHVNEGKADLMWFIWKYEKRLHEGECSNVYNIYATHIKTIFKHLSTWQHKPLSTS